MQKNALGKCRTVAGPLNQILLIMRLTAILLTCAFLQVHAAGSAQSVTLSGKEMSLKKVFQAIETQTGYVVFVNKSYMEGTRPVTLAVHDMPLQSFLELVFTNQPLNYQIKDKTIVLSRKERLVVSISPNSSSVVTENVIGQVVDADGKPLANINITVKGSSIGTVTNADGKFSLDAKERDVLIITGVGFETKEIKIGHQRSLMIVMNVKQMRLDTATVIFNTGYQKISKERATGSFDFIDNKKFNEQVGTTVLDRLAGIANSVAYNKSSTGDPVTGLVIRGISTINGGRTPLIVVDNFPYNGDLNNINPNDVENISVLKDAAAASIWGAKAGNGVIVITTKHGSYNKKMSVELASNLSLVTKLDLFSIKMISSSDLIDAQQVIFKNGGYDYREQDIYGRPALPPVVELLIKERDHQISSTEANAQIDAMRQIDIRKDLDKYVYRKGFNQQYSFGVSGGSNNILYRFSGGYDKNVDNLHATMQRINLSSTNTFRPTKNLEISAGLFLTQLNSKTGAPSYSTLTNQGTGISIYSHLVDKDGKSLPFQKYRQPFVDTLGNGKLLDWNYYPLEDYKHSYITNNQLDLNINTSLDYQLTKLFKLVVNYQYERQVSDGTTIYDIQSYYTRDLINLFTLIPADGSSLIYPVPKGEIDDFNNFIVSSHQARGQLNFEYSRKNSQITALAGTEIRSISTEQHQNRIYGYDPNSSVVTPVDYVNIYTNIINGFGQGIPFGDARHSQLNRFVSMFMNAGYTYQKKYTITGSVRRDASNIFGASTNNRWQPLWSTGAAWEISKESFYHSALFPRLKFRGSFGYSGNVNAGIPGVTTIAYLGTNDYSQRPYSNFQSYNNPDLRWENVGMTNMALDFGLKNNRITGTLEYYHKKTNDLYGPIKVDYTALPVYTLTKNVASTEGHGIDLQLTSRNFIGAFKWKTELNFSWYRDRVLDYYVNDTTAGFMAGNGSAISHGGKNAVYGLYVYPSAGLDKQTGAPQGYLNTKVSSDYLSIMNASYKSLLYKGATTPVIFGNICNIFEWKNLSLFVNIIYKLNYYFQRESIAYASLENGTANADFSKRWQKPGDELRTNVPSFIYPLVAGSDGFYNSSDVLATKGDNIRIDYLKLNYSFKLRWMAKAGLTGLNLHTDAKNFKPFWTANKLGIDPDNQYIKTSTVFSFGLNASF